MHSLTNIGYEEIRAAVLSFIQSNEPGTYALDNHFLTNTRRGDTYTVFYRYGCHSWTFNFNVAEVRSGSFTNRNMQHYDSSSSDHRHTFKY